MEAVDLLAWFTALGLGGGISAFINWFIHKDETAAHTDSITVATAESVVDMVRDQLWGLKDEIVDLKAEVVLMKSQIHALATEVHDLGGDPDEVMRELLDKSPYERPHS